MNSEDGSNISIEPPTTPEDIRACVALQRAIWSDPDPDLIPPALFVVANKSGGQTLLARDGDKPVGFSLAFAGLHGQMPYLHSHIVGVLPEYQNRHVGRQMKLKQRELALAGGVERMEWTFDPLAVRNAYFNIVRLGAIVRSLHANLYGVTSSPLHGGLPTDRLVAEWLLSSDRVRNALAGRPPEHSTDGEEVQIPPELERWRQTDSSRAAALQSEVRERLQTLFARGLCISDFRAVGAGGTYLLTPAPDVPSP